MSQVNPAFESEVLAAAPPGTPLILYCALGGQLEPISGSTVPQDADASAVKGVNAKKLQTRWAVACRNRQRGGYSTQGKHPLLVLASLPRTYPCPHIAEEALPWHLEMTPSPAPLPSLRSMLAAYQIVQAGREGPLAVLRGGFGEWTASGREYDVME